jgi:exopolysaccharide production protein ExoF
MKKRFIDGKAGDGKAGRTRALQSGIAVAAGLGAFLLSSCIVSAD